MPTCCTQCVAPRHSIKAKRLTLLLLERLHLMHRRALEQRARVALVDHSRCGTCADRLEQVHLVAIGDQQQQVRFAVRKNGYWHLQVDRSGEYEFELRRWPRESELALAAGCPFHPAADGEFPAGEAMPIARARSTIRVPSPILAAISRPAETPAAPMPFRLAPVTMMMDL